MSNPQKIPVLTDNQWAEMTLSELQRRVFLRHLLRLYNFSLPFGATTQWLEAQVKRCKQAAKKGGKR